MRLFLLFLLWLMPGLLMAAPLPGDTPFSSSALATSPFSQTRPAIPPVDQAMPLAVSHRNGGWQLHFTLMPNVYLYRQQLRLELLDAKSKLQDFIQPVVIPPGQPHEDAIYGKTEVFFGQLTLDIPAASLPATAATLRIGYQGCLENVLCYPPQEQDIPLVSHGESQPEITPASTVTAAPESLLSVLKTADANHFASWAQEQSLLEVLLLFFVGGLLMAFTPCVFPMIPILLGILAGEKKPSPARGLTVSLGYVLGMAVPYTLVGLLVAATGARMNLQVWLQQPVFILIAALVFILLSLSMFGVFSLQMSSRIASHLGSNRMGSLPAAFTLGAVSALIVSPCITPILAGALLFVAAQGHWLTGALALFILAIGMGVPLLIVGAGGASLLPKAGAFMEDVTRFFGLVLLLMAAWLLGRLLSANTMLWIYGAILLVYAVHLGAFDGKRRLRQAFALLLFLYASLLWVGASSGKGSLTQPLAGFVSPVHTTIDTRANANFTLVPAAALEQVLAEASVANQPVLVDFFADWCTACHELDETTLKDSDVLASLSGFRLLRVDITDINAHTMGVMERFGILGLPCLIFFDRQGEEIKPARILGYMNSQQWLDHMKRHVLTEM